MRTLDLSFSARSVCRVYEDKLRVDDKVRANEEAKTIWNLAVPITKLPQGLPYGPNARNASLEAKPAREMLKTLSAEPENFIFYNSGIMLIAEHLTSTRVEGGDFKVSMRMDVPSTEDEGDFLGHGILNGGHTYKAITHALHGAHKRGESYPNLESAFVQVSIAVGIEEHEIPKISKARNVSISVPLYGLKNLKHDWKPIEKALPQNYRKNVIFKPNEDEECGDQTDYNVTDLVRRLALLNNKLFDFREDKHPIKAYSSLGSLVEHWNEEQYKKVIPRLSDILWLEQKIMEQHVAVNGTETKGKKIVIPRVSGCSAKPMTLITGKQIPLTIGEIFYMPVLAAFRVLLKEGEWIEPKEALWEKWGPQLVDRLWDTYKNEGRNSASTFAKSKSTWSTLTNLVAMHFVKI